MERGFVLIIWGQTDEGLCARLIALFSLQASRESGLIHLTNRRHIIISYPLPEFQLARQQDRLRINDNGDGLYLVALRLLIMQTGNDAHIVLITPKGNDDAYPLGYAPLGFLRDGISKETVERYG
jgi:hypothetical protein